MNVKQYNDAAKRLDELFRLRSMPIAFKFLEKKEDIPEGAILPVRDLGHHMALCQAFTYARIKGLTMAMTKEDHWCWTPLISFGHVECVPGQEQFDQVVKVLGVKDLEKGAKFFAEFPRAPLGKYEATVMAPLATATFEPDVVIIYAEVPKINHMIRCIKSVTGTYLHTDLDGIDSCIYCTLSTMDENDYRVTFPDPGDKERALARDDEVILSIPASKMDEFMEGIEGSAFMGYNDKNIGLDLDFARPAFYNKLFEIWGLEQGPEWKPLR